MSQPERPVDPPEDLDTPVDWDKVDEAAAEAGCKAYHRKLEEDEI